MKYQREDIVCGLFCCIATGGSIALIVRDGNEIPSWLAFAFFGLGVAIFLCAPWLREYHHKKAQLNQERVCVNNGIIERWQGNKLLEKIALDELTAIHIATSADGPWLDDICWILIGRNGGALLSNASDGFASVLDALQTLPGFDDQANQTIIEAMSCTESQQFDVWQRP